MVDPLVSSQSGYEQGKEKENVEGEKANITESYALLSIDSPETQSFIRTLLEKSIYSLKPVMSFERGATYPEASQIFNGRKSEAEIQSFLFRLATLGLLDKQIVDRIIACPSCKATRVYSKYQCVKCHSFDVSSMQIIEHLLCGYIGPKTSLVDGLICPQCKQKILSEKDYRSLGKTFGCLSCQYRFETPPVVHRCEDCGNVFSYNQANYSPVYEFIVSMKTREDFTSGLLSLKPVIVYLREQGYVVESPKEVAGISGSKHRFDVVAHTGGLKNVLLGDFAFAPSDQVIIATFAKKYDVNPSAKSFVVSYAPATKDIDSVAKIYGISIIVIGEGKMPFEEQLRRMLSGTPQVIAASKLLPPSTFYLGPRKEGNIVGQTKETAQSFDSKKSVEGPEHRKPLEIEPTIRRSVDAVFPAKIEEKPGIPKRTDGKRNREKVRKSRKKQDETDDYYFLNDSSLIDSEYEEENDYILLE